MSMLVVVKVVIRISLRSNTVVRNVFGLVLVVLIICLDMIIRGVIHIVRVTRGWLMLSIIIDLVYGAAGLKFKGIMVRDAADRYSNERTVTCQHGGFCSAGRRSILDMHDISFSTLRIWWMKSNHFQRIGLLLLSRPILGLLHMLRR